MVRGNAIKITYQNGNYELICHFSNEYVENGKIQFGWLSCDVRIFNKLISNFL